MKRPDSPRICVVSLNPAVDAEWRVPAIVPGEKNELTSERRWPGGKGINVARWLKFLGASPHLVLPLGGAAGRELATGLKAEGLPFTAVPIRQSSRVNVVVTPEVGSQLRFNPTWPVVSRAELEELKQVVERSWQKCQAVVLSGSLVRGAPLETYAVLVQRARQLGVPVVLDCDGAAFRRGVLARPTLVKPNLPELAQWSGGDLPDMASIWDAARKLASATSGWVLASLGPEGAILVDGQSGFEAAAPAVPVARVRNTVGAGDALLAAAILAMVRREPPAVWLSTGLRTAAGAVRLAPGELPRRRIPGRPNPGAVRPASKVLG